MANWNIARPYALAAFEVAEKQNQLDVWKAFLESAANVAKDPIVAKLLLNPELGAEKAYDLFESVLASQLDATRKNFLLLLAQNKRLSTLPAIVELYNAHYASLEKISKVRVITAVAADEPFRKKLTQDLTKQTQREITLQCEIDPSIIGGAIIHMGDRVIDDSIRGKLTRLLNNLTG